MKSKSRIRQDLLNQQLGLQAVVNNARDNLATSKHNLELTNGILDSIQESMYQVTAHRDREQITLKILGPKTKLFPNRNTLLHEAFSYPDIKNSPEGFAAKCSALIEQLKLGEVTKAVQECNVFIEWWTDISPVSTKTKYEQCYKQAWRMKCNLEINLIGRELEE